MLECWRELPSESKRSWATGVALWISVHQGEKNNLSRLIQFCTKFFCSYVPYLRDDFIKLFSLQLFSLLSTPYLTCFFVYDGLCNNQANFITWPDLLSHNMQWLCFLKKICYDYYLTKWKHKIIDTINIGELKQGILFWFRQCFKKNIGLKLYCISAGSQMYKYSQL